MQSKRNCVQCRVNGELSHGRTEISGGDFFASRCIGYTRTRNQPLCNYFERCFFMKKLKFDTKKSIEQLTLTAMFIGLAAVCKFFSLYIPLFGGEGMRVGLSGIFTAFPAFLFGPLFGGLSSAASDIIGCIIAPSGAYNPLFTLTAFAGGFIKGLIWAVFVKAENKKLSLRYSLHLSPLSASRFTLRLLRTE